MSDSAESKTPGADAKASGRQSPVDAAKELTSGVLGTVQTRLELLSNELAEERARLEKMLFYGVAFLGTGIISIILITFLPFVLLDKETNKEIAFGGIVIIYISIAFISGLMLRKQMKDRGKPFQHTIDELRKDRERLGKFIKRD